MGKFPSIPRVLIIPHTCLLSFFPQPGEPKDTASLNTSCLEADHHFINNIIIIIIITIIRISCSSSTNKLTVSDSIAVTKHWEELVEGRVATSRWCCLLRSIVLVLVKLSKMVPVHPELHFGILHYHLRYLFHITTIIVISIIMYFMILIMCIDFIIHSNLRNLFLLLTNIISLLWHLLQNRLVRTSTNGISKNQDLGIIYFRLELLADMGLDMDLLTRFLQVLSPLVTMDELNLIVPINWRTTRKTFQVAFQLKKRVSMPIIGLKINVVQCLDNEFEIFLKIQIT